MRLLLSTILAGVLALNIGLKAQTNNDILNVLVANKTISQEAADSLRADAAIKQQESDAKKKSFPVTAVKSLKVGGYGHFRYQRLEEAKRVDGADIRRAYFDLRSSLSPYWDVRLQADFAGSPKLIDLNTDLKLRSYFNITIGQQVIPFSLNSTTSNTKLELPDRVPVVEALTARKGDVIGDQNGRDIGVSLFGTLLPVNGVDLIEYRLGIFNGSGINRADLNEANDFSGRVLLRPIKGLELGGSYYLGWSPDSATLFKSANPDNVPKNAVGGKRDRYGFELSYTYKFAHVKGEYLVGQDNEISRSGYYVQAGGYILKDVLQLVGRYDTFDPNTDVEKNAKINYTLGVNYAFNSNILLQAAYTIREEEGTSVDNNFGIVQLQVVF